MEATGAGLSGKGRLDRAEEARAVLRVKGSLNALWTLEQNNCVRGKREEVISIMVGIKPLKGPTRRVAAGLRSLLSETKQRMLTKKNSEIARPLTQSDQESVRAKFLKKNHEMIVNGE